MDTVDMLRLRSLRLLGARSRLIQTSLGRLHILEWQGTGPRPPIVLIHGLASCAVDYGPLMRWLRRRHSKLIAPDLPGHGYSSTPKVPLTADRMTTALLEMMDAVVDEPVIVFGNSLGGIAAIRYARLRPEHVLALILASPGGAPMDWPELHTLKQSFDLSSGDAAMAFTRRFLGAPQAGMAWMARGVRVRMGRPGPKSLLDNVTPEVLLRPSEVRGLQAPTLVMWGDQDEVLPRTSRRFFSTNLPPHGRFEALPGFGHSPYLDDLSHFGDRMQTFVDGVLRAAPSPRTAHGA
ncbi:MAG: hypothetical protein CL927_03505 [Deltaproteobacteria bacterium]|nr:hypothetical protein [Deltaproteobacteria bacterium]